MCCLFGCKINESPKLIQIASPKISHFCAYKSFVRESSSGLRQSIIIQGKTYLLIWSIFWSILFPLFLHGPRNFPKTYLWNGKYYFTWQRYHLPYHGNWRRLKMSLISPNIAVWGLLPYSWNRLFSVRVKICVWSCEQVYNSTSGDWISCI